MTEPAKLHKIFGKRRLERGFRDFGEGDLHEIALRDKRMRDLQVLAIDALLAVKKDVDVDRAVVVHAAAVGIVFGGVVPAEPALDVLADREDLVPLLLRGPLLVNPV